jgi:type I restriction enzyme S subunit
VGEVILNQLGDVHIARQFMSIRSKSPQLILPKYIELIIKASIEKLRSTARGIIPGISREDILEMTVAIPPLAEQKRILTRISELESSLSFISLSIRN